MTHDELQIRELVDAWHRASRHGDTASVLRLMADDAIFLTPGTAPMSKQDFAALMGSPSDAPRPKIETTQEIQEIEVSGDLAFMRSALSVRVTPPDGGEPHERSGHTLTVFKRLAGSWLLARDANLLSPRAKP